MLKKSEFVVLAYPFYSFW